MKEKDFNPSYFNEGFGALAIVASVLSSPLSRPWYSTWGATEAEVAVSLPGDEMVPRPMLETTRAITINAPASAVWPWLAQLGQGRGGLYSYQRLENLAGCEIHNADRILPEYQDLQIGDQVRLGPEGYPAFEVVMVEPGQTLVLRGDTPNQKGRPTIWIWCFFLASGDEMSTRLLLRSRLDCDPTLTNKLIWRAFTDPIAFNMERKMLQGIKVQAEAWSDNPMT